LGVILTAATAVIAAIAFALVIVSGGTLGVVFLVIFFVLLLLVTVFFFWMMFKIIWTLLKAFVNIILLTIFAPFLIALGVVIPSIGFGKWIKDYISNLAVFVVSAFFILLSLVFLGMAIAAATQDLSVLNIILGIFAGGTLGGNATPGWPPLINPGLSTPAYLSAIYIILSFVVFTMIPKSATIISSLLSGRPFSYGTAIGEAFAPITYGAPRAISTVTDPNVQARYGRMVGGLRGLVGRPPPAP